MTDLQFIDLSGSVEARGRLYGQMAAERIRTGVGHYRRQLESLGVTPAKLETVVKAFLPAIESFDDGYVPEMRAIADGAGVALAEIVLINARTEILKIAGDPKLGARFARKDPDGCTAVVAAPEATAGGSIIHAHNWDWKMEAADSSVMLRVRRDDGPDYLMFTEAGALGRFGVNSAGLAITANYLECDRDYRDVGVPLALIRRKVMDQAHLATAVQVVCATEKSGSNNIVLSDETGMVLDFECAPDEPFLVEPEDGILIHANHWISPAAQVKLRNTGHRAFPCSFQRQARARALLKGKAGAITIEDIRSVLLDDYGAPWSICRPPRPSAFTNLSATVASLILEPKARRMEIAMLPALGARFVSYSLD